MERLRDDLDGMYEDIRENYYNLSKSELIDIIMDNLHQDQSDDDLIEAWVNFCDGKVLDRPSDRMLRDQAMESLK